MARFKEALTFTTEEDWEVPELCHIKSFEDLTLITGSISVEADCGVLLAVVLVCKCKTSAHWNLCTNYAVATVEARCEHVHRSAFAISDPFSSS